MVWKISTSALSGHFFLSKVDDIKMKSKVSAFFLPLPLYLPFIALLSLLFAYLQDLKKALNFSEIKVQLNSHPKRAFFSPQKPISKVDNIEIISKVSAFFLPVPLYLPFIALLSLLFSGLQGLKKA